MAAKQIGAVALAVLCGCSDEDSKCAGTVGNVCPVAGQGPDGNGLAGDEGRATAAELSLPMDTLTASDGTVFIVDWNNNRIRSISPDGTIHFATGGVETLDHPTALLFDADESQLLIAGWFSGTIMRFDRATSTLSHSCGDGKRTYTGEDGPAESAGFNLPVALARTPDGDLLVMDEHNQVIRRVDANGMIHRFAGRCVIDALAPDGPGACPRGVAPVACPPPSNAMTCGDPATTCQLRCNPAFNGEPVTAVAMRMAQPDDQQSGPSGRMAYDATGELYFADTGNRMIRRIDRDGIVHVVLDDVNHPTDLAFGADGTLYFTEVSSHCVRARTPDGAIRTVAGVCGTKGHAGDGGPATSALFDRPYGIEWVAPNTLYISDTGNNAIRRVVL